MTEQPSEPRVNTEIEVPGTPEDVWEAIATGPGISAWFHRTEVEERPGGGFRMDIGDGLQETGRVSAYDRPHRFAYEEAFPDPEGGGEKRMATEFLVEARSGGTCIVRVVTSGFGPDDDDFARDVELGWRLALLNLRVRLADFAGEPHAAILETLARPRPQEAVWRALTAGLGIDHRPGTGDRLETAAGAPRIAGTVIGIHEGSWVVVRTEEPAPGVAFVGAHEMGGGVHVRLYANLYGRHAGTAAEDHAPRWRAWLDEVLSGDAD
jgi:uncharacterized protein YndB with AHSA1/START domain